MKIQPTHITLSGPGVDLSNHPEGLSVEMSDPVQDLEYARNAVTLTFDLSGHEHVRLSFKALEYGDEPHAPPPGPFGDDVNFDGVAVSADGAHWYEIQDLRSLRSDKLTAYDLDLDAAVAALGLSYGTTFRIRFCQYDDNPAPMDGFSIQKIELEGDLRPPILHLTMDDNAASATVVDASEGHLNQTFVDPGGNPNTNAHSVAGINGTALAFDGVDDYLRLTPESHKSCLAENHDFAITFWWKVGVPYPPFSHVLSNYGHLLGEGCLYFYTSGGVLYVWVREYWPGDSRTVATSWPNGLDGNWHHYALVREGSTIRFYQDGQLTLADTDVHNSVGLAPASKSLTLGKAADGDHPSPGSFDDFRLYDRALLESEIQELAAMP